MKYLSDGTFTELLKFVDKRRKYVCRCQAGDRNKKCDNSDKQENTLIPWSFLHTKAKNGGWKGVYGRLDWDGVFKTTLTNPSPTSQQGRVIHPEQVSSSFVRILITYIWH